MRTIEEIRVDCDIWLGFGTTRSRSGWVAAASARDRLLTDIPGLLSALAEKDAEIEKLRLELSYERDARRMAGLEIRRLEADLYQSRAATDKLSKGIWKVC